MVYLAVKLGVVTSKEVDLFATPFAQHMCLRNNYDAGGNSRGHGFYDPDGKIMVIQANKRVGNVAVQKEMILYGVGEADTPRNQLSTLRTIEQLCGHPGFENWLVRVMFNGRKTAAAEEALAVAAKIAVPRDESDSEDEEGAGEKVGVKGKGRATTPKKRSGGQLSGVPSKKRKSIAVKTPVVHSDSPLEGKHLQC